MSLAGELPTVRIVEPATVRLVPTAYYKPPVLKALADSERDEAILATLEGLTNGRLKAARSGLAGLDPRELAFGTWGTSYVNAAFSYTRPGGNRFNPGTRGAWYCAFDDLTAIEEVAFHKTRELRRVDTFDDEVVYQALLAGFIGEFADARGSPADADWLGDDPDTAYPAGQRLAEDLLGAASDGLVYPSVRRPGGTCLVAIRPQAVRNVRPGARWRIAWSGSPSWSATAD